MSACKADHRRADYVVVRTGLQALPPLCYKFPALPVPTLQKRMITASGWRSPVPTKIERVSHCSAGADVSKAGVVAK